MAVSIDELSAIYGLNSINAVNQTNAQMTVSSESEQKAADGDSYISTMTASDTVFPSENYNDLARQIKAASTASQNTSATEYASVSAGALAEDGVSQSADSASAGAAGGAGGGSGDSGEDTETEVVVINGVSYLQTTTTDANGNTTVTRVPLSAAAAENNTGASDAGNSAAAQALTASF